MPQWFLDGACLGLVTDEIKLGEKGNRNLRFGVSSFPTGLATCERVIGHHQDQSTGWAERIVHCGAPATYILTMEMTPK